MALYNFKKQFVPKILSGEKRHTIRAKRARATKPGEMVHLYTGLRQKGAQLLMRTVCTKVEEIQINGGIMSATSIRPLFIFIDMVMLSLDECEQLARSDGFSSLMEMVEFWKGRTPFCGDIVHWQYPPYIQAQEKQPWQDSANTPAAKRSSMGRIAFARTNAVAPTTTKNAARCATPSARAKRSVRSAE